MDAHQLPFGSETFAAVAVIEALHHFADYNRVLEEIFRVLKRGGTLLAERLGPDSPPF